MLLNWQGRHFMEINHSRITSYEIADYMIRTKSLLSAKELAAILEKEYPHLDVDKRDVYLRLKAIAVSYRVRSGVFHQTGAERDCGEKERREHQPWVMARQLFNKVVRQHRHY
ncbi:hypothetical protein ACT4UL_25805, partial [Bacillus sp. HC-TM]